MGSRLDSRMTISHQEARSDDHIAEAEIHQVMCEVLEEIACKVKLNKEDQQFRHCRRFRERGFRYWTSHKRKEATDST